MSHSGRQNKVLVCISNSEKGPRGKNTARIKLKSAAFLVHHPLQIKTSVQHEFSIYVRASRKAVNVTAHATTNHWALQNSSALLCIHSHSARRLRVITRLYQVHSTFNPNSPKAESGDFITEQDSPRGPATSSNCALCWTFTSSESYNWMAHGISSPCFQTWKLWLRKAGRVTRHAMEPEVVPCRNKPWSPSLTLSHEC